MVVRDVLPNGLRLLTEAIPHVRSVSMGVWLTRGSRHEGDPHPGIAHFVEHMLFKGTTTRSAEDIAQAVDSVGGQMDASTGKENANYAIKVLDEHLDFAVDLLSDVVLHPRFAADDVEREKSVIGEEIKMVEDMPDDLVHELFLQRYWMDHPLGRPILGTQESIDALDRDVLARYFGEAYTAGNLDRGGGGAPRARPCARAGGAGVWRRRRKRRACRGDHARPARPDSGREQGSRAEPRLPGHRAHFRRITPSATWRWCSTRCSAGR